MSVGGWVIEKKPMQLPDNGADVVRYWVVDTDGTELCVYGMPSESEPSLGENIWWGNGRILFDRDRQSIEKVGFSFKPSAIRSLADEPRHGE